MSGGSSVLSLDPNPLTLTRAIMQDQRRHPEAKGDLTVILNSIGLACKFISNAVRKAGIASLYGIAGDTNVQGETQKKLDVIANDIFKNALKFSNKIAAIASEEEENVYYIESPDEGKYVIAFDPLDGSSNIDVNVSIGSIFGIWKRENFDRPVSEQDFLRKGNQLEAAGYCIYGSSTQLVLATKLGKADCFTLDPSIGDFILTTPNLQIPRKGNIYSINEGNTMYWDDSVAKYIHQKKNPDSGSPYSLRYVGSMVSDVHRTILYGGIFLYPGDKKSPAGKLRVLYEVLPMAFIVKMAGGKSSDGKNDLLDLQPTSIHQRSPCILGSQDDVNEFEGFFRD